MLAVGVTVYSITANVLLVLVAVPIIFPVPASFNCTPDKVPLILVITQLKELDVPLPPFAVSSMLSCGLTSKLSSEQTITNEAIPTGSGFTIISKLSVGPSHSTP